MKPSADEFAMNPRGEIRIVRNFPNEFPKSPLLYYRGSLLM
jgi:hypothetical protein